MLIPTEDTINLLKECDAGCKMGIDAIKQVIDKVENKKLYDIIVKYLNDHQKLQNKITDKLNEFDCSEEQPSAMAKAMSHMKINFKLVKGEHDKEIADLITDGCNMGIKSINKYMNQYPAALESIKSLCYDLAELEENFAKDLRHYL